MIIKKNVNLKTAKNRVLLLKRPCEHIFLPPPLIWKKVDFFCCCLSLTLKPCLAYTGSAITVSSFQFNLTLPKVNKKQLRPHPFQFMSKEEEVWVLCSPMYFRETAKKCAKYLSIDPGQRQTKKSVNRTAAT